VEGGKLSTENGEKRIERISQFPGDCFRCGDYGHAMHECPWLIKAATAAEHEQRRARIIDRWAARRITTHQKWQFLSDENKLQYGEKCTPLMTYPRSNS
jgi:hypothetical protein